MYPILQAELLGRMASVLVTCSDDGCSKCARGVKSEFTHFVVAMREQAGLPTLSW